MHHPRYNKVGPKEGFDRLTANRTNYDLGTEAMGELLKLEPPPLGGLLLVIMV